jgi:hypothetical protein
MVGHRQTAAAAGYGKRHDESTMARLPPAPALPLFPYCPSPTALSVCAASSNGRYFSSWCEWQCGTQGGEWAC